MQELCGKNPTIYRMLKNTTCVDPLKIRIVPQSALFYLWENTRNSNKYYNTPVLYSKQIQATSETDGLHKPQKGIGLSATQDALK